MHFPDRVLRTPLRPITIGIRIEVRFKNRFQHQLGGGLHHSVPYGRNPQWTLAPARLRDFHPPHGLWCIRLCPNTWTSTGYDSHALRHTRRKIRLPQIRLQLGFFHPLPVVSGSGFRHGLRLDNVPNALPFPVF